MCAMDFVIHHGITHKLTGMSVIQRVCLFDVCLLVPLELITKILFYLENASVTKFIPKQ